MQNLSDERIKAYVPSKWFLDCRVSLAVTSMFIHVEEHRQTEYTVVSAPSMVNLGLGGGLHRCAKGSLSWLKAAAAQGWQAQTLLHPRAP